MTQNDLGRWWEFDSYFGPIEIQAQTEAEAYEMFTKLMKRLFLLAHFIEVAFERNQARRKEPTSRKGKRQAPPSSESH